MKAEEYTGILDAISQYPRFAIFGAQVVATGAYTALKALYSLTPECFIVSSTAGNPAEIDGIPVKTPDAVNPDTLTVIAVTELLQDEIAETLATYGYRHIFRLTAHREHLLMSEYFNGIGKFPPLEIIPGAPADVIPFLNQI
jgi:hypothetical protein